MLCRESLSRILLAVRERLSSDVAAILHAVERYLLHARIRATDGLGKVAALPDHRQHAAAGSDETSIAHRGPRVIHAHSRHRFGALDPIDDPSRLGRLRVAARGKNHAREAIVSHPDR